MRAFGPQGGCRTSSLADTEATQKEMAATAANATAVLRRHPRGSAYQPPAGDQTERVSKPCP
jgi:hypothetical protein